MSAAADAVREYYAALNSGDAARIEACFAPGAEHYFTTLPPVHGGAGVAEQACNAVAVANARFKIERLVAGASEAAVEYSVTWDDIGATGRTMSRGVELFEIVDGLIVEIRSYQHTSPKNPSGDLVGFDHAGRGYAVRRRPRA